ISKRGRPDAWLRGLREREAEKAARQAAFERSDQVPIHHFRLAKELDAVARSAGDSMFVADGGNWVAIAAKVIALRKPGRWLDPGRYDKVVEALGGHGEHVTEPSRIRPALERAVASGTVACVNVVLDPDAPAASGAQGYAI